MQIAVPQGDAAGSGRKPWARNMDEHGAAAAGDPWPCVVVDFNNVIIEVVSAVQAISWFTGRPPEGPVITPIGGVLAPGVRGTDAPGRQARPGPQPAVPAPPQSERAKAAARSAAIALALVGPGARAAERNRDGQRPGEQPAL